ncbi:hypothetical protein NC651_014493 [Populus alba x Populus x berolinensis]|nr:hypothetical protein NC651_014493 [Populus alba x Populus x berolinensis]
MNYCIHPFKDSNLADTPGKRVGVVGPGGLGHVAVKFGKAFGRHAARRSLDFIVDTVSEGMLESLKVAVLGAPDKPIEPPAFPLILGKRSAKGSMTGSTRETQETLDVRGKHNISCDTELVKP